MDKMIIENFRKYMGKSNRQLFGWIFTWITSVLMFCVTTKSESVTLEKLDGFNTAIAVMLLLIAVNMYIDKYSKFYGSKDMDRTEDLALLRNETVIEIMKRLNLTMDTVDGMWELVNVLDELEWEYDYDWKIDEAMMIVYEGMKECIRKMYYEKHGDEIWKKMMEVRYED